MKTCEVQKSGRKWVVVVDGSAVYTAKTRVACFRWISENNLKITSYQHGGH